MTLARLLLKPLGKMDLSKVRKTQGLQKIQRQKHKILGKTQGVVTLVDNRASVHAAGVSPSSLMTMAVRADDSGSRSTCRSSISSSSICREIDGSIDGSADPASGRSFDVL